LFAPVDDGDGGRDSVLDSAARVAVDELEAWLAAQEPPEAGAGAAATPRPEGGPDGAAAEDDRTGPAPVAEGGHIDPAGPRPGGHIAADQRGRPGGRGPPAPPAPPGGGRADPRPDRRLPGRPPDREQQPCRDRAGRERRDGKAAPPPAPRGRR